MNIDDIRSFDDAMAAMGFGLGQIKRLHPTLKKCRCGLIDKKAVIMRHITDCGRAWKQTGLAPAEFWEKHGEVPLNEGDV